MKHNNEYNTILNFKFIIIFIELCFFFRFFFRKKSKIIYKLRSRIQDIDYFENKYCAGLSKCKRTRKYLMTPRPTSAVDKCKISHRDTIHIITVCIEAVSLSKIISSLL